MTKSETKRCTKKSDPIFRCTTPSTGKRLGEVVVVYHSVPTTTSPNLFPVDGVVHRNIGSDFFVHFFVSLLVNKILLTFVRMRVKNCRSFTQFCKNEQEVNNNSTNLTRARHASYYFFVGLFPSGTVLFWCRGCFKNNVRCTTANQ